ncbi:Leucine rich repeat protein, partial [Spraguea lophii 42_110]
ELTVECKEQVTREIDIFEHVPTNSKIKHLEFYRCYLTSIPSGISKLINLETFTAEFNQIIILENVFIDMASLKSIGLSFNRITNIDGSIFDITTLEKLDLSSNQIELLPSNINNMKNRNLQVDLCGNPLHLGIDVNPLDPELIVIEQVDDDLLGNIIYDEIETFIILDDTNLDLDVKKFYEELNIPINERLNLEKIKLCKMDKPANHTKTRQNTEEMLRSIFNQTNQYKSKEKLNFLLRRIESYYYYEDNLELIQDSLIDYQKRNSIIDHFEYIVITMIEMLPEKQGDVEEVLVRLLDQLNFNYNTITDEVYCLDGQEEAFIAIYLFLKQGNVCSSAEEKIIEIITNLKFDILKEIITGKGDEEEAEV